MVRLFLASEVLISLPRLFLKNSLKSCDPSTFQRNSWALRAQSWTRSWKWAPGPGPPAPGVQQVKNGAEKESKVEISTLFRPFDSFFDSVARGPRELSFNSVSNFGPEGPKNSSERIEGSQLKRFFGEGICDMSILDIHMHAIPVGMLPNLELGWAAPEVLWKKAPQAMRAMRGTTPFKPFSISICCFGCTP